MGMLLIIPVLDASYRRRGGSGAGGSLDLLASASFTNEADVEIFSRAVPAGFSGSGETAFQREADVDVLRSSHYAGGVRCVFLQDDPVSACALVAPGVPVVTPGELTYTATITGIPVTASLLRYESRKDGTGSWISNGTSTSFSGSATTGDHVLNVRAVSTSGIAGATATSATFTVTGPVAYDFEDDFEVFPNTNWTVQNGTPVFNYATAPAPLVGTKSLKMPDAAQIYRAVNNSKILVYTQINGVFSAGNVLFRLYDASFNVLAQVVAGNVSGWYISSLASGATPNDSGTGARVNSTTYHCWFEYEKGTGSDGQVRWYISTTAAKPGSPTIAITNSAAAANGAYLFVFGPGDTILDKFKMNFTTPIGSNP